MKTKKRIWIYLSIMMGFFMILTGSCGKDNIVNNDPINNKTTIEFNPKLAYGTLTDQEGNVYKTIVIGTQTWMAENLKVTKYNDNTEIPNVTDGTAWDMITCGAYCNYENDANNVSTFGRLYNWKAVYTGKLAPLGWHVPTDTDWYSLINYLIANGYNYDGTTSYNLLAKSVASSSSWMDSESIGTVGNDKASNNKSGFTGMPGGMRNFQGKYGGAGGVCYWWSSTTDGRYSTDGSSIYAFFIGLTNNGIVLSADYLDKIRGLSVRCIKD